MLKQTIGVMFLNFSNLASRKAGSAIVVVGIGGVVAVLLGLLAMSSGFKAGLIDTAKPDRAIIVRSGSNSEMEGWIGRQELEVLKSFESLDVVSGETYTTVTVVKRASGTAADAIVRGVTINAFELRPEVEIVAGRKFQPGKYEVIVGVQAARQYAGLNVGETIDVRHARWTVVGHFRGAGSSVESEIWVDLPVAQDVFRRTDVSVARVRLHPDEMASTNQTIANDPRVTGVLIPETLFYASQAAARAGLIETFAYVIAGIMALGSVIAALNTMYTAVSHRTLEIATLRALGFNNFAVVASVVAEATVLATCGALIAALVVYLVFDGVGASTVSSGSQVAFAFRLTPDLIITGLAWALALGFVGGLLPAYRAARLPITQALRGE